ncbi:unnamed protein product [Phytophthora fragariaefolia]|uniref:Unnamed protein product n=1 Tax=Phytophthora fragariaefolia TaxID=1490495 RepID=A0A9W6UC67_9STRA|nr:unnamed protein product [Phytophthora fragariaefolia]
MAYAFIVKELRQFLGLATYLCKYVNNYAGKIRPVSQLLKKDTAWDWTAECQQTFDAVKQGLTEAPILVVADQDRPFHVVSEASDFAIGCALMQHDNEGRTREVHYQSRLPGVHIIVMFYYIADTDLSTNALEDKIT